MIMKVGGIVDNSRYSNYRAGIPFSAAHHMQISRLPKNMQHKILQLLRLPAKECRRVPEGVRQEYVKV